MNSIRKQILAAMGGVAVITALAPGMAFADSVGAFEVNGGVYGTDYSYADNVLTVKTPTKLTITNLDVDHPTSDRIVVEKDKNANLTLDGVNIQAPGNRPALEIGDNSSGNVNITLADNSKNVLRGGGDAAGLQKNGQNASGTLTIGGSESGSLEAVCTGSGESNGAGIGGGGRDAWPTGFGTDNIKITGGTITATGRQGAGIGAGVSKSGFNYVGRNITITGGIVTATSTGGGAGIGGGCYTTESVTTTGAEGITISGGIVTATSMTGAGIGGGYRASAQNITINGGTVTAMSTQGGAGIGGGRNASAQDVFISGGSVKASGSGEGADIGNGRGNGKPTYLTPKTGPNGDEVQLLTISNPSSSPVKIDGKDYEPVNHGQSDTNLYAYLTKKDHLVVVGDKQHSYKYENGQFVLSGTVSLTNPVTLRINSNTNEWEVSYDDGDSWENVVDDKGNPVKATGSNGTTPQLKIDENNNWCVSYDGGNKWASLGVPATGAPGAPGKDGVSIIWVEKTGSSGLEDTYTITYSDGNKSIFRVTNGAKGEKGDKGDKGDTGATGAKGDTGAAGKDGVTPQVKIDKNDYWCVSYDNGKTWQSLGVKAPVAEKYATTSKATASFSGSKLSLSWNRIEDASGYEIYVAKCGSKGKISSKKYLAKTVKKASTLKASFKKVSGKKVNGKYAYKAQVRAYQMVKGKKKYLDSSPTMHVVSTSNATYTNAKKIKVNKGKVSLKAGKSKTVKATVTKASSKKKLLSAKTHVNKVRWYSTNKKVATVSSKGKITAKKKGKCTVYAVAANGKTASVKVTVK